MNPAPEQERLTSPPLWRHHRNSLRLSFIRRWRTRLGRGLRTILRIAFLKLGMRCCEQATRLMEDGAILPGGGKCIIVVSAVNESSILPFRSPVTAMRKGFTVWRERAGSTITGPLYFIPPSSRSYSMKSTAAVESIR